MKINLRINYLPVKYSLSLLKHWQLKEESRMRQVDWESGQQFAMMAAKSNEKIG